MIICWSRRREGLHYIVDWRWPTHSRTTLSILFQLPTP